MAAAWASDDVIGFEAAFAFSQIGEEEDRRFAFVASNNDVPCSLLGLQHGERFLSGLLQTSCRLKDRTAVSVLQPKKTP